MCDWEVTSHEAGQHDDAPRGRDRGTAMEGL